VELNPQVPFTQKQALNGNGETSETACPVKR